MVSSLRPLRMEGLSAAFSPVVVPAGWESPHGGAVRPVRFRGRLVAQLDTNPAWTVYETPKGYWVAVRRWTKSVYDADRDTYHPVRVVTDYRVAGTLLELATVRDARDRFAVPYRVLCAAARRAGLPIPAEDLDL